MIVAGVDAGIAPHAGFLANLRAYASHLGAELRVYLVGQPFGSAPTPNDVRDLIRTDPATVGNRLDIRCHVVLSRYSRFPA